MNCVKIQFPIRSFYELTCEVNKIVKINILASKPLATCKCHVDVRSKKVHRNLKWRISSLDLLSPAWRRVSKMCLNMHKEI